MRTVDQHGRAGPDFFHASADTGQVQAGQCLCFIAAEAMLEQAVDDGQCQSAVEGLVFALEWYRQVFKFLRGRWSGRCGCAGRAPCWFQSAQLNSMSVAEHFQLRVGLNGTFLQGRQCFGILCQGDGGDAFLENAAFFASDIRQLPAKQMGMVVADLGDGGDQWLADVGAVQAAA